MIGPSRLFRRLRHFLTLRTRDREIDDELAFHLEMETRKHVQAGLDRSAAASRAARDFGGVARFRDDTRDAHGVRPLEDFLHDVRVAARSLTRQRSFAAVSILTLAIGIGGTTAVFGAVYGVLLAPLPYRDQDRVMTVWQTDTRTGIRDDVSAPNFIDWRERSRSFAHLALAEPYSLDYLGPDGPEVFENAVVTEGFLEVLGVTPILGRGFSPDEFLPGRNQAVLVSETLWRTRFGGDSTLVGRKIVLDGNPMTVVGVLPAAVDVPWNVVAWTPKVFREDERTARGASFYAVIGRLRDGLTMDAAQRELSAIARDLAVQYPATNANTDVAVVSIEDALLGSSRKGLFILMGAMGFVLMIACVNVASLQLAQAVRRRRELATRATLGAGVWRIARQLFTESLVLALVGGFLGVLVAYAGIAGIRTLAPAGMPRVDALSLDPAVLVFALAVTLVAAVAFGLAPVLDARRLRLAEAIATNGRTGSATRARRRSQQTLVIVEVALALVLMVGAGLLVRSFRSLLTVERGFEPDNVLVMTVQSWGHYRVPAQRVSFARDVIDRLSVLPGVRAAGMASSMPLAERIGAEETAIAVEGWAAPANDEARTARVAAVTPGYFAALRIPLIAGRMLDDHDRDSTAGVILVNEAFARQYWPDAPALGKRVAFGFQRAPYTREVVGIVADIRRDGLDQAALPTIYAPHAQAPTGALHFAIHTDGDPRGVERAARQVFASLNGTLPITQVTTLEDVFSESIRDRRFHLSLLAAFSLTALILAAIGIYGVLSQAIGERTQEIGVRVAVGASTTQVLAMIMRQGTVLAAVGMAIGLAGALVLTRVLGGMLFQVTPLDPIAFGAAAALLFLTALLACLIPARRAARLDPVAALRE